MNGIVNKGPRFDYGEGKDWLEENLRREMSMRLVNAQIEAYLKALHSNAPKAEILEKRSILYTMGWVTRETIARLHKHLGLPVPKDDPPSKAKIIKMPRPARPVPEVKEPRERESA